MSELNLNIIDFIDYRMLIVGTVSAFVIFSDIFVKIVLSNIPGATNGVTTSTMGTVIQIVLLMLIIMIFSTLNNIDFVREYKDPAKTMHISLLPETINNNLNTIGETATSIKNLDTSVVTKSLNKKEEKPFDESILTGGSNPFAYIT